MWPSRPSRARTRRGRASPGPAAAARALPASFGPASRRTRGFLALVALTRQFVRERAEVVAAPLEVVVLVVAGARGAEEHDVARDRLGEGVRDGAVERGVAVERSAVERAGELVGGLADEVDRAHTGADRGGERREALALERTAQDQ